MVNLSIVILSYNTQELTIKCIEAIVNQYESDLKNGVIEIIIVDNASLDKSLEYLGRLKNKFSASRIKIIKNKENFGFAKGCNIGAKMSEGQYILFLNSDTEVLDKGLLKMVDFLETHKEVGILGGKLLNPDGSPQPSVGKFYNLFNLFLMLLGGERFGMLRESPKNNKQVDWVSGACFMLTRGLFEKTKGFDEFFFMYVEDMELCFRAKTLGLLTYFYPDVSVVHQKLGSSNKTFAIINIYKGILYFYKKHKSYLEYLLARFLLTMKASVAILAGGLLGNNYLKNTYKQALEF